MKEYLKNIFPKIISFSKKLDDLSILVDKKWISLDKESHEKEVWIFCKNGDFIISRDGKAKEGKWRFAANSIYIKVDDFQRLINNAFIDDVVLLLQLDGGKEFIALANEMKIDEAFKIEKYLDDQFQKTLFPPAAPVIIPEPPEIIKPAPMSLSEQIERQQIESANDLVVFIIFFIGGIALLCGSLFISDTKSNIALIVFSLLLLLLTLIIILPIYFKSKSKLKNLLDEQIRGSENQSDLN